MRVLDIVEKRKINTCVYIFPRKAVGILVDFTLRVRNEIFFRQPGKNAEKNTKVRETMKNRLKSLVASCKEACV